MKGLNGGKTTTGNYRKTAILIERERESERERRENLNLFLFYNRYMLGRMPLFHLTVNINNRIIT